MLSKYPLPFLLFLLLMAKKEGRKGGPGLGFLPLLLARLVSSVCGSPALPRKGEEEIVCSAGGGG